jgi:phosphatidylglycerol:prolipoprotein diacylglycerol transferase
MLVLKMDVIKLILEFILALDPVMVQIGPLPIRWYSVAYVLGFVLGWRLALYFVKANEVREEHPNRSDIDDFLTWAVIGVILGGRLGYVLFYNLETYAHAPLEALKIWHGGMSFHGGMIGVVAAMIAFSMRRKVPLFRLSDIVASVVPIGLFFGRMANFINGELYGRVTDHPIGLIFPHSDGLPRHPSQIYQALGEGAFLFLLLLVVRQSPRAQKYPGVLSGVFLIGYGTARIIVENFREPDSQLGFIIGELSMGQILSVPMVIAGIALILFAHKKQKSV